jgi:hypothetical protein
MLAKRSLAKSGLVITFIEMQDCFRRPQIDYKIITPIANGQ